MIGLRLALAGLIATTAAAGGGVGSAPPDPVQVVRVSQSGGFTEEARAAIAEAAWITGSESTVLHRVTIRLLAVNRGLTAVQTAPAGFGYPMLTTAADPAATAHQLEVRRTLVEGEMVMGELAAELRGARVGDVATLEGLNGELIEVTIGAIVPDRDLGWSEIWIDTHLAAELGVDRPQAILLWGESPARTASLVRHLGGDPSIRVSYGSGGAPPLDPVLPVAAVKERFGEFAIRPGSGDSVQVDPEWRDRWIVNVDFPLVGPTRCHRLAVPYVRGALAEVEAAGLADLLSRDDFQLAGGCWVPRFNRGGDPGFSLSRHAWGAAIDFNPSNNQYGAEPTMPAAIVDIFRRWGFSWGGTWTVPDGMHFEWVRYPDRYSVVCSTLTVVPEDGSVEAGWAVAPRESGCP
ncbi:MAG TPA: M15 family metallopeptidase [Acidimicrobiia bacterium]|nr:M15 family metallopeptidase [Acidimicrobiia bacterium]